MIIGDFLEQKLLNGKGQTGQPRNCPHAHFAAKAGIRTRSPLPHKGLGDGDMPYSRTMQE